MSVRGAVPVANSSKLAWPTEIGVRPIVPSRDVVRDAAPWRTLVRGATPLVNPRVGVEETPRVGHTTVRVTTIAVCAQIASESAGLPTSL